MVCEFCSIIGHYDDPTEYFCVLDGPIVNNDNKSNVLYDKTHTIERDSEEFKKLWDEIDKLQEEEREWRNSHNTEPCLICKDFSRTHRNFLEGWE